MVTTAGVRRGRVGAGLAVVVVVVVGLLLTGLVAPPGGASTGTVQARREASQTVTYRGYQLQVPSSWQVVDLEQDPTACVRLDRHVVYLGHPSASQDCPVRIYGRTEALVIEPSDSAALADRRPAAAVTAGQVPAPSADEAVEHLQRMRLTDADLVISMSWNSDRATAAAAVSTGRLTATTVPSTTRAPVPTVRSPKALAVAPITNLQHVTGQGFDACGMPSDTTKMAALKSATGWVAAGFYLGGMNAGCPQLGLGASWVRAVANQGWTLIPTWVGRQLTCSKPNCHVDFSQAFSQGVAEADAAVDAAASVGISVTSPIYLDMEAYNPNDPGANAGVVSFVSGWTARLHSRGYRSGFYSSTGSGIAAIVAATQSGAANMPDSLWIAHYDCNATTADAAVPSSMWVGHRIRQYRSPSTPCQTPQANIGFQYDSNALDGETSGDGLRAFVEAMFTDFLGRAPTEQEIDAYVGAGQVYSRTQLSLQLASQPAWATHIVVQLYRDTLGRGPDAAGLAYWQNQISSGRQSVAQVAAQFYASREYFIGFGRSDLRTWVTDLYAKILHRTPDTNGLNQWVFIAAVAGRPAVTYPFYQSTESARDRVTALYQTLLGRSPDEGGLEYWSAEVQRDGDIALAANLAGSDEYYLRAQARF